VKALPGNLSPTRPKASSATSVTGSTSTTRPSRCGSPSRCWLPGPRPRSLLVVANGHLVDQVERPPTGAASGASRLRA
jgi:hypothetical protein